jgi:hypothetical protein
MKHDRYMRRDVEEVAFLEKMDQLKKKEKVELTEEEYKMLFIKGE